MLIMSAKTVNTKPMIPRVNEDCHTLRTKTTPNIVLGLVSFPCSIPDHMDAINVIANQIPETSAIANNIVVLFICEFLSFDR